MKALVLCAGKGTRLQPFTYAIPKHILPLANTPMVGHIIKKLVNLGITEIGLIVGYLQEELRKKIGNGAQFGAHITYIEQIQPKGLAHAVKMGKEFVHDDPFMVYLGDNIFDNDLSTLVNEFQKSRADATILLKEVPNPERFGIAVLAGKRLIKVIEKPQCPPSNCAIAGVYLFNKHIFPAIDALSPSWRGEYEITDAIQALIDKKLLVTGITLSSHWYDTGTPADLLAANKFVIDSQFINQNHHASITISNSKIINPVSIAENVVIDHAVIGPYTSIGSNSRIQNCTLKNSIIMNSVHLENIDGTIQNSIIGHRSELSNLALSNNSRLIIGCDNHIKEL